jgi:hypothetical protein
MLMTDRQTDKDKHRTFTITHMLVHKQEDLKQVTKEYDIICIPTAWFLLTNQFQSCEQKWETDNGTLPLPLPTPMDGSSSLSDELSNSDISTTLSSWPYLFICVRRRGSEITSSFCLTV